MIKEDYVSFETAKLLKEKGFDGICGTAYETITNEHEVEQCSISEWGKLGQVKRPTLQMAMKWLREVHKLHISIDKASFYWNYGIYNIKNKNTNLLSIKTDFSSYEQAVESALDYILKNLI